MSTLPDYSASKAALARKAEELATSEFISRRIYPLLGPTTLRSASDCRATIVRNTGTGRLTIRYAFDSEIVVFGKLYSDDLGIHSFEVNRTLWNNGFNNTGPYRVPQPLGLLPDHSLLLIRGVRGKPLGAAFDADSSVDLISGIREAAEWLTALHLSTLRVGSPETELELLKQCWVADLVLKAVTVQPDNANMVCELVRLLERRTAKLSGQHGVVFTHGRYHHDHVFLSSEATSVIDLDRCRTSAPAKDVAEFIRLMRLEGFRNGLATENIELATSEFLSCYLSRLPQVAEHLGVYVAAFVFHSLLRGLKQRTNRDNKSWQAIEEFHVQEIHRALRISE